MLLRPPHAHDVFYRKIPHHQRIRDQRPMAAPRHRLGAHNSRRFRSSQLLQTRQPHQKLIRLHIIRKPAKTGVVPTQVHRIRLRMPQSTQFFQMHIPNSGRPQMPRQSFPIKLWIVPRTRNTPHIHHTLDAMRPQHRNKVRKRPRRMSDRENRSPHFLPSRAHLSSQNHISYRWY